MIVCKEVSFLYNVVSLNVSSNHVHYIKCKIYSCPTVLIRFPITKSGTQTKALCKSTTFA